MKYFISAGEASGDLHAAALIDELRRLDPKAEFTFLGGDMMAEAAGHAPLIHYRDMAYMGFSEVLRNLGKVAHNLRTAREALKTYAPDRLVLVDYPSFNLKLAAAAAKAGIITDYYISPKIWAWKKWRIRDIRRLVRHVYSILPFEPDFYHANGAESIYVGNPSVGEIDKRLTLVPPREEFFSARRLRPHRPLVALMPGSRRGEIRNNLPVMLAVMAHFPQYRGVIVGAPGIDDEIYSAAGATNDTPVLREESAVDILVNSRAALVTSGTATLETALAGVPQVAVYRANGSRLSYNIMKRLLSVRFVTLPNLIADREIIPEMLLHLCTPESVAAQLEPLLRQNSEAREAQLAGSREIRGRLGDGCASARAATLIISD